MGSGQWRGLAAAVLLMLSWPAIAAEAVRVLATLPPLAVLARDVGGDTVRVDTLLSAEASPHHLQLRASQRQLLAEADLVLWAGPATETALAEWLAALPASVLAMAPAGREAHPWVDPARVMTTADALADALAGMDPTHAEAYRRRAGVLREAVQALDVEAQARLVPLRTVTWMTSHDLLGAWVTRYGLHPPLLLHPRADYGSGPRHVARVRRSAREAGAVCVIRESDRPEALERTVLADTPTVVGRVDLLRSAPDYPAYYRGLVTAVSDCLAAAQTAGKKKP